MAAASSPAQLIPHDDIKFDVVRFNRKRFHDLKTKCDPDLDCAHGAMGEEPIKKTCSASDPRPRTPKCNSGDEHEIERAKNDNVMSAAVRLLNSHDCPAAPVHVFDL